jgi:hypothetical protein
MGDRGVMPFLDLGVAVGKPKSASAAVVSGRNIHPNGGRIAPNHGFADKPAVIDRAGLSSTVTESVCGAVR